MPSPETTRGPWWIVRWHVARWMIHTALKIAPPGRTRDELTSILWRFGEHIMEVVSGARQ